MPTPLPEPDVCDIPRIASFRVGNWNGRQWDRGYLKRLHDSFKQFSEGPSAYYRAYLSVNHDKFPEWSGLRFGRLTNAKLDGDTLYFDAEGVPTAIGKLVKAGNLSEPSLEFVEPKRDAAGKAVSGFADATGKIVEAPVIKCLTLIGNDIPGVKGLPPLPGPVFRDDSGAVAKFSFTGGILHRFAGAVMQTRDQMIAALQAAGMDTSQITDAVPDALLAAILALVQGANANPTPAGNPADATQQMADAALGTQIALPTPANPTGGAAGNSNSPVPSQVVLKFNQQFPGMLGNLSGMLGQIQVQARAVAEMQAKTIAGAKEAVIAQLFRDTGLDGGTGQITPAMQPTLKTLLMGLDHVQTRKFATGTATGTALEEMAATIKSTYPAVRAGGRQLPQPGLDGNGGGHGMDPERRRRMLSGSPVGMTVLKAIGK